MTDVVNEICELKLKDVGDGFGHFGRQHRIYIRFTLTSGTNIQKMAPTVGDQHSHIVTNFK